MSQPRLNIDLRSLRAFCEVADSGRFSVAGERLGITQAAVSKCISRLEAHVQAPLFTRSTRRVALTDDGHRLLPRARAALAELDDSFTALRDARGEPSGRLTMTVLAPFARLHLLAPLAAFMAQHPRLQLDLHFGDGLHDMLAQGHDLVIGHAQAAQASYTARLLCTWQYVVVASPTYLARHGVPREPADLARHACLATVDGNGRAAPWEFVAMNDRSRRGNHARSALAFSHQPEGRVRLAGQLELVIDAARAGLGIGVAATSLVRPHLERGDLKVLLPQWRVRSSSDVLMMYRAQGHLPLRVRAVIDHLVAAMPADDSLVMEPAELQRWAA